MSGLRIGKRLGKALAGLGSVGSGRRRDEEGIRGPNQLAKVGRGGLRTERI